MNFNIEKCSQLEWAENSLKMSSMVQSVNNYIRANTFSSLQFLPEDIEEDNFQAYRLKTSEQKPIAWINIIYISKNVIRIRGLYVVEENRKQGAMSYLLNNVLELYKRKALKVISFSRQSTIQFHEKNGFQIEKKFVPRKLVLYDPYEQKYFYDPGEELTLMTKIL